MPETARAGYEFLRHTIATLAYRGGKVLKGVPESFASDRVSPTTRTPGEILAHVCDLLDWSLHLCSGRHVWRDSSPGKWEEDASRFFEGLRQLDEHLVSGAPISCSAERLFQGPVADALTHIGQIAMLRRMCGIPVRGENYFKADIRTGFVGSEQPPGRVEFD
jgi:hypothetical protein